MLYVHSLTGELLLGIFDMAPTGFLIHMPLTRPLINGQLQWVGACQYFA